MKPICVKCGLFFKPKKNGIRVLEQMPMCNGATPGLANGEQWQPYKIWHADLWSCRGCGVEMVFGTGVIPLAERHQNDFAGLMASWPPSVVVNDC
jgi:hypothetical protein